MTFPPSRDPLVSLWHTAPKPDIQNLMQDLARLKRMHLVLKGTVFAFLFGTSILLIIAEASGHIATHGALSAVWIPVLAVGIFWKRRARCNGVDALALDTVSLLKRMIARARNDMVLARRIYTGIPSGALVGGLVTKMIRSSAPLASAAVHPRLDSILTGAGVAVLIIMVVTGIVLARSRRLYMQALEEKLRSVEAEL